jgi:hypothetical protein
VRVLPTGFACSSLRGARTTRGASTCPAWAALDHRTSGGRERVSQVFSFDASQLSSFGQSSCPIGNRHPDAGNLVFSRAKLCPTLVPVGLLQELLGIQLSAGSIASFVKICHHQLAGVEKELKAALVKTKVIQKARNRIASWEAGMVDPRLCVRSLDLLCGSSQSRTSCSRCHWHSTNVSWYIGP